MPMSSVKIPGSEAEARRIMVGQLPVEIYLEAKFDTPSEARQWATEAAPWLLEPGRLGFRLEDLERAVLWGPRGSGYDDGTVYMSEVAVRILRAACIRVPATKVVSVADLKHGLKMYAGGEADRQLYERIKVD
jgi:hypothetical protein